MKRITIFYDNWCPNCSRFIRIIDRMDWLNLITIKKLREEQDVKLFSSLNYEKAKKQMASYNNEVWNYGFSSLFGIFVRLPAFWIISPFLYFLKVTCIGQILYMQLAVNRKVIPLHCSEDTCEVQL